VGIGVKEREMSDQQDMARGGRTRDDVIGSTSGWDGPDLGDDRTGQGMPSSFAGQPMHEGDRNAGQRQSGDSMSTAQEKSGQATEQAGSAIDAAKERATQLTDQATTAADAGMDKAAGGLDTLAGTLRDRGEAMGGGSMATIATTAAEKMEAGAQVLREKDTEQIVSDLEALVRRKPIESVLVAAGIGFVLSKIVR
jgi:ElaB/YqjD/DUF883 family membrane-anchored ribosome-binding protein